MSARQAGGRRLALLVVVALLAALIALLGVMAPAGATTPEGPFAVDLTNREAVRRFYYTVHEASEGVPAGWTGNVARCDPGTVSADFLDATRTRINYFRAMAGVPSDVVFTAREQRQGAGRRGDHERAGRYRPQPAPHLEVLDAAGRGRSAPRI